MQIGYLFSLSFGIIPLVRGMCLPFCLRLSYSIILVETLPVISTYDEWVSSLISHFIVNRVLPLLPGTEGSVGEYFSFYISMKNFLCWCPLSDSSLYVWSWFCFVKFKNCTWYRERPLITFFSFRYFQSSPFFGIYLLQLDNNTQWLFSRIIATRCSRASSWEDNNRSDDSDVIRTW